MEVTKEGKSFGPDEKAAAIDDAVMRLRKVLEASHEWDFRAVPTNSGKLYIFRGIARMGVTNP